MTTLWPVSLCAAVMWTATLAALIYGVLLMRTWRGLQKLSRHKVTGPAPQQRYSVIIAAHNEARRIGALLQRLAQQDYPSDRFEVVVAADRCSDGTGEVVEGFRSGIANLRVLPISRCPQGVSPKKNALKQAIGAARHEYLVFLDADVLPQPGHLRAIDGCFREGVEVVVSLMKFHPPQNFWQHFLVFEKLISWAIAAAGVARQKPVIAYGGNWAYSRRSFEAAGGFEGIATSLSGDDDLLLQKMGRQGARVGFCLDAQGWVRMAAPPNLRAFLRQRRRHFSAARRYRPSLQAGYALFHLSHLLLWLAPLLYWPAAGFLAAKVISDFLLLRRAERLFAEVIPRRFFLPFNLLYLLYNSFLGPAGHLGRLRW